MKQAFAVGLFLFALGCLVGHGLGCGPSQVEPTVVETRAKNALDADLYRRELADCRALGKDAGSLAVYETCAKAADTKHGVK